MSLCAGKGASAGRRGSLVSIIFFKLEPLRGRQSITSVREGRGTEKTETCKARSTSKSKHPPPPVSVQKGMAKRNRCLGTYTDKFIPLPATAVATNVCRKKRKQTSALSFEGASKWDAL